MKAQQAWKRVIILSSYSHPSLNASNAFPVRPLNPKPWTTYYSWPNTWTAQSPKQQSKHWNSQRKYSQRGIGISKGIKDPLAANSKLSCARAHQYPLTEQFACPHEQSNTIPALKPAKNSQKKHHFHHLHGPKKTRTECANQGTFSHHNSH
jgi:hypothetical protein